MNNKKFGIITGIIATISVMIGAWLLFNSTYTTNIDGGESTTIFLSIRPENQFLPRIILLTTIVIGIIILLKSKKTN